MDPFSISLGVLPLIHLTGKTVIELKKFQNGATEAKDNIIAMLADLKLLETVLNTIKDDLEDLDSRAPLTGHIGEHWVSLKTNLDDGCDSLKKLEALLVSTNKDVRWMSSTRRAIRLKDANDQIGMYRQSIQDYKDVLQLSLQSVMFSQQRTIARDVTELLEKFRDLYEYFSRQDTNNASASHLKHCVRTAATVVASVSTVVGEDFVEECGDESDIVSEFGWKVNGLAPNKLMSEWLASIQDEPDVSPDCLNRLPDLSTGVADSPLASQHTITPGSPMTHSLISDNAQQEITSGDGHAQSPLESSSIRKAETEEPGDMIIQNSMPGENEIMVDENRVSEEVCSEVKRVWTFVGDGECGKTWFINSAIKGPYGSFPEPYEPTGFESHLATFQFRHEVDFECTLWDTVGNDDVLNAISPPTRQANQVRSISYPSTEIFCLCFSIDNWESLHNVVQKWLPEIEPHICGGDLVLLLGLKQDLRYDGETILELKEQGRAPITMAEGEAMAEKIGALAYFECSAKRYLGIENVFETVLDILLEAEM